MKQFIRFFSAAVVCITVVFIISGCMDSDQKDLDDLSWMSGMQFMVSVNTDGAGGTGSYSIIQGETVIKDIVSFNTDDLGVTVWNGSVFVFGRYGKDWLARFDLDDPADPIYQYSTIEGAESTMNPKDVVIANNNTGYVFRYGSSVSWIIDPSPVDEPSFRIGYIDLSDYETEGYDFFGDPAVFPPNPVQARVNGNTMYVLLERSNGWAYDVDALLLTVDISAPASPAIIDAFTLKVRSPNSMQVFGDSIYIAGWGNYYNFSGQIPTGGIERVNISGGPGTYSSVLLVDDDDGSDTLGSAYTYGGATLHTAVVSSNLGYICFGNYLTPLYRIHPFNPGSGTVDTSVTLMNGVNVSQMAVNPEGNMTASASYVSKQTQAGIYTIEFDPVFSEYSASGPVSVGLQPSLFSYNN